ncbi:hypothetical protein ACFVZA_10525 [Streptomyces bottropensis]|uniref:hypothetical protein n=1 Tax=Streptomyces bottropensis TaxID=42235 RepID=UPI00369AE5C7
MDPTLGEHDGNEPADLDSAYAQTVERHSAPEVLSAAYERVKAEAIRRREASERLARDHADSVGSEALQKIVHYLRSRRGARIDARVASAATGLPYDDLLHALNEFVAAALLRESSAPRGDDDSAGSRIYEFTDDGLTNMSEMFPNAEPAGKTPDEPVPAGDENDTQTQDEEQASSREAPRLAWALWEPFAWLTVACLGVLAVVIGIFGGTGYSAGVLNVVSSLLAAGAAAALTAAAVRRKRNRNGQTNQTEDVHHGGLEPAASARSLDAIFASDLVRHLPRRRHISGFQLTTTAVVGLLSGTSALFGVIANEPQGLSPTFLALGGLAAAAAAGLTFLVQGSPQLAAAQPLPVRPSADERRAVRDAIFQSALLSVSEGLAALPSMSTDDSDLRGKVVRSLVQTAAHLAGETPCLAAFYALEPDPDDTMRRERLVKRSASQEIESLPDIYREDGGRGAYLLDIAEGTMVRRVTDVSQDPDGWRIDLVGDYQSALFVPVRAGAQSKGLLVFQAAEKGVILQGPEREKFLVVAHLLGACEAIAGLAAYRNLPAQAKGIKGQAPSVKSGRRSE